MSNGMNSFKAKDAEKKSVWSDQWDSPWRWSVKSQSDSHRIYVVDLATWECQCTDFRVRHMKQVHESGGPRHLHTCYHIRTALREFYRTYVRDAVKDTPIIRFMDQSVRDNIAMELTIAVAQEIYEKESHDEG